MYTLYFLNQSSQSQKPNEKEGPVPLTRFLPDDDDDDDDDDDEEGGSDVEAEHCAAAAPLDEAPTAAAARLALRLTPLGLDPSRTPGIPSAL